MKKQDITYQDKLNELRLDLSHPNNKGITFVLLEGESDIRLFRKLFNLEYCKVEAVPGGNNKLEVCVGTLVPGYPLIIGIRDADFIHLKKQQCLKTNIFLTDYHDMEMMLIVEDAVFSSLLFEYTTLEMPKHSEVKGKILKIIEEISLLKWLNDEENLEYKFAVGFQDLISYEKGKVDFEKYYLRVLTKSPDAKNKDIAAVWQKLIDLKKKNPDVWQLCNGHDFMKALSRFVLDRGEGRKISEESISSIFRTTYTFQMFSKTKLYNSIKTWADTNNSHILTELLPHV